MIPDWSAVIAAFLVAAVFFTAIGLPLARAVAPRGMPALAMAPALGWAVFNTLALPLLSVTGFARAPIAFYALAAIAAAGLRASRRPPPQTPRQMPRWGPALAAGLAILPTMAVMPKATPSGILLAPPIFDHVKIAIVDAILRTGLPVPNPFYGPHGAGHLAYYYLWHFGAALLARALGLGGWAAEAAMTGFTAYAALLLTFGAAAALTGARARAGSGHILAVLGTAALLLAGTARPVLTAAIGAEAANGFIPRSADLGGWLNQAAWVPQHLASACCLILAALLMLRLAAQGGMLVAATLGVVVAAGFESSIWIGGVALAATACLPGAWLLAQAAPVQRRAFILHALGAAALTAILVAPFIVADLQVVRLRHAGAGMALRPYATLGAWVPAGWRAILDAPAFWIVLLPFALPATLPLAAAALWRLARYPETPGEADDAQRRLARLFWMVASACLAIAWLVRSTIDNNDLGWRAVLPAILLLTALAGAELARLAAERRVLAIAACLAVGALGLPDTGRMVRDYAGGQLPGDPHGVAGSQPLWQALRRHSGPLDRVANNPLFVGAATPWPVNIAWATLSDRPSCFAGWETMIAYGPLATPRLIEANALFTRVFDGHAAPGDVRALAADYGCATAVVTRGDGAWADDPFAVGADYRLAESGGDFRVYVRR